MASSNAPNGLRATGLAIATSVLLLTLAEGVAAQEPSEEPLAEELIAAESVCIMNSLMHFSLYTTFLDALDDWERLEVVDSPDEADIIMALSARPDFTTEEGGEGRAPGTVMVMDKLYFKIFLPGGDDLWVDEVELGDDDQAAAELIERLRARIESQESGSES